MVRAMSPAELGQIRGLSEFPVPTLRKKKKLVKASEEQKAKSKENLYERLPESLKVECLVRTKMGEDEEVLRQRQEMTRTMTPAELGEIRSLSDFPFPTLRRKTEEREKSVGKEDQAKVKLYDRLPQSLKAECLVRSKVGEDEEVMKQRQALVRSMSPTELSQIHSLSDFPIPSMSRKTPEK